MLFSQRSKALSVLLALFMSLNLVRPATAVNPSEVLADPALEARARVISAELRCLVCQNQSIDDSDAQLARDLRVLVRERLTAGDTDGEVIDYLVARYGEFVLLKPRFALHTLILWASPVLALLFGIMAVFMMRKRSPEESAASSALSDEEETALSEVLQKRR